MHKNTHNCNLFSPIAVSCHFKKITSEEAKVVHVAMFIIFIFVCTFVFDTVTRIVTYLIVIVVFVGKERALISWLLAHPNMCFCIILIRVRSVLFVW